MPQLSDIPLRVFKCALIATLVIAYGLLNSVVYGQENDRAGVVRLPPVDAQPTPAPENSDEAEKSAPPEEVPAVEADSEEDEETKPEEGVRLFPLWDFSAELGFNGSMGNNEVNNLHVGGTAKRKTPDSVLSMLIDYRKQTQESVKTGNRLFYEWRNELLFPESPVTAYLHGTVEFDEFREFDVRIATDAGVGYEVFNSDVNSLKLRGGIGTSREIGGVEQKFVPEGVFGLDASRSLTKRQKLSLTVDWFPDWTRFDEYRLNAKASWELILDAESHLSLKLGMIERYDSTPNGAKPGDLDYSALLLWKY